MSEPSEQDEHEARSKLAQRRSQELVEDSARLHDRLLDTARSVRRSHEQTAETMDNLADTGSAEHAMRRRETAERSRKFAEQETRHIAEMTKRPSGERIQGGSADDEPDADADPT